MGKNSGLARAQPACRRNSCVWTMGTAGKGKTGDEKEGRLLLRILHREGEVASEEPKKIIDFSFRHGGLAGFSHGGS